MLITKTFYDKFFLQYKSINLNYKTLLIISILNNIKNLVIS